MTSDPEQLHWPGGGSLGETLPEGWYTRGQAAKLCGRSYDTLRRWHQEEVYIPRGYVQRGELVVWAYDERDIANLRRIAKGMRPGRKPKKETT